MSKPKECPTGCMPHTHSRHCRARSRAPALANCQLPVTSCGDSRATSLRWHINSHVKPDNRKGAGGELTRRQPTYLCRAELQLRNRNPNSAARLDLGVRLVALTDGRRSRGCVAGWNCDWRYRLCSYTSCGQTTQYINSPALAYFILRKKIMANIRELCDAAHQRANERAIERAPRSLDAPLGAHSNTRGRERETKRVREREIYMCIIIYELVSRQALIIQKCI